MLPRFQQFIRERQYLHNVSPATVSWHTHNLKWLPSDSPTEAELKAMVVRMREKGLRATGCNSAIRHVLFDDGAIALADDLTVIGIKTPTKLTSKHQVGIEFIRYHREHFGVLIQ